MDWNGFLHIKFRNIKKDTFYYDVKVSYNDKVVEFLMPRYDAMVGWIEVFGLPPQNEWVFLDNQSKPWAKDSILYLGNHKIIGNLKIKETLKVYPNFDNSWRKIEFNRQHGKLFENQTCIEDWSEFKDNNYIKKYMVFDHSNGQYFVTLHEYFSPLEKILTKEQKDYIKEIKNERGKPTLGIWLKKFECHGEELPIYKMLFPFWGKDISQSSGTILEIGYKIDKEHGDWYKLFNIGKKSFEIQEYGFTKKKVKYQGKFIEIKNTYTKKIRQI